MTPFEEDEDTEHYLTTFKRLAAASQWPSEIWVLYLVPLLKGKSRAAYVAMSVDDSRDYNKVKQAISGQVRDQHGDLSPTLPFQDHS